jgi:nicotinate-nucleotide adenylyltransferase
VTTVPEGARRPAVDGPAATVPGSIGVLGGTFDPVHVGHLALAEEAREALGLERVLFVPAGIPPHKRGIETTSPEHRLAMVELALAANDAFEASAIELDRSGPSWTVDTADALAERERAAGRQPDLTFLLSAESFRELPTWREPLRLLDLARIAVAPRPGVPIPGRSWVSEHFPGREHRVVILDGPHLQVAASEIRSRIAAGRSVRYLVPDAVVGYIADHDLYTDPRWRKTRP